MKTIPLGDGEFALIDDADFDLVKDHKWTCRVDGRNKYATYASYNPLTQRTNQIMMHRSILGLAIGQKVKVDHRDRNGLNNQRSNIRIANNNQNGWNQRLHISNTSGFKGIYWDKNRARWRAELKVNYRKIPLGDFKEKIYAALAHDAGAIKYHGEFATTNASLGLLFPGV